MTAPDDEDPRPDELVDRILADEPATPHRRDVPVDYPNPAVGFVPLLLAPALRSMRPSRGVLVAVLVALLVVWAAVELWG